MGEFPMIGRRLMISVAGVILAVVALDAQTQEHRAMITPGACSMMKDERFEEVAKEFNVQMAAALPASQLRDVWANLRQQVVGFALIVDERVTTPFAGVTAVMLGAGLLACVEPSRRALRINPIDAVRDA